MPGRTKCLPRAALGLPMIPNEPSDPALMIGSCISLDDVPGLCIRLHELLSQNGTTSVVCDVRDIIAPDAESVDALARLQLAARRRGGQLRLRNASSQLIELLVLGGLEGALEVCD